MDNNLNTKINRDGLNLSIWQSVNSTTPAISGFLEEQIFDTLIVGGGITGITTAHLLQKQGQKCLIAEANNLGFGTTGGTTAHLNTFLDTTYPEIESDFNENAAAKMASATKDVIDMIDSNIQSLAIKADFEYKDGFLFSQNEKESKELQSIFSSSKKAGIDVKEVLENGVAIPFEQVLLFKNQAQFHPLKYIIGLAGEFTRLGGKILENTFIESSEFKEGIHHVKANGKTFKAKNLVYATHIPPGINILSLRNAPYRSYVIAIRLKNEDYPDCLAYDMKEPYHYFRSHEIEGQKYLILGGADHKTGHEDPSKAFQDLENYARENFEVNTIDYHWSSQYYVPVDGLPYIGQLPGGEDRTFIATGFNGNGMILGSLSGQIISDLILEKENKYADLLSPSRLKPISGFMEFVKENADVAYHIIADRFGNHIINSTDELKNEEGKIVEFGGEKLAIYKNSEGKVTALSPVCTHAGCIVNWNPEEKSWDCPCHGGRYTIDGKVITGPPRKDLKIVSLDPKEKD